MAVKQAVKKGAGIHKKGLSAWKEKTGMAIEKPKDGEVVKLDELSTSNANKEQGWILMPKAFQDVTKLPGVPKCLNISILGHSNVGKSTLMNHALASAQKQGLIPVIIDTENAFSFQYAKTMGFEAEPIYGDVEVEVVDEETGEVTIEIQRQIVNYEGDFIYYNNKILAERFGEWDYGQGKKVSKKRKTAVVEDIAMAINELLDAQEDGEIDRGFLFAIDSIGSLGCWKEYASGKIANAMWLAGAVSQAFNDIINNRIPSSKKVSCPYDNTLLYINKIWMNNTISPTGPAVMTPKAGMSMRYATRMEIVMGKETTAGVKFLKATSKGFDYTYGIQTYLKIKKNHLDAPHNVCYEGPIIATDCGFIGVDELDEYKKSHVSQILKELNKLADGKYQITESDLKFEEVEEKDIEG